MNNRERAIKYFMESASCAQSILAVYGPLVGLPEDECFKIGASLGGGVGRKQYICGAINAGAIIIGLKYGNAKHGELEKKSRANLITGEFITECEQAIGSSQCSEILKIDLSNPDEYAMANDTGLFDRVCNNAIEKTAEILEKYLYAENLNG